MPHYLQTLNNLSTMPFLPAPPPSPTFVTPSLLPRNKHRRVYQGRLILRGQLSFSFCIGLVTQLNDLALGVLKRYITKRIHKLYTLSGKKNRA